MLRLVQHPVLTLEAVPHAARRRVIQQNIMAFLVVGGLKRLSTLPAGGRVGVRRFAAED